MLRSMMRGSFKIFASSTVVKILSFLYVPILARWLGPEKLGTYGLAILLVPWFSMLASLGAEATMTKLIAEHKAQNKPLKELVSNSFILLLITGSVATMLHWAIAPFIANYVFNNGALTPHMRLASLIIFVQVVYFNVLAILRGEKKFGKFALVSAIQQGLLVITGTILVYLGIGVTGAVLAWILGTAVLLVPIIVKIWPLLSAKCNTHCFKLILKTGLGITLISVIIIILSSLDRFFLGVFTSETIVGIYIPALTIVDATLMINMAMRKSMFSFVAESFATKPEDAKEYVTKTIRYALLITGPVCVAILIHAREIITILAGSSYIGSVGALKITLPMALFSTLFIIPCMGLVAAGKSNTLLKPMLVGLAVSITVTALVTYKLGLMGAAISNVINSVAFAVILGFLAKKILRVESKTPLLLIFLTIIFMCAAEYAKLVFSFNIAAEYSVAYCIFAAYVVLLVYKFTSSEERKALLSLKLC